MIAQKTNWSRKGRRVLIVASLALLSQFTASGHRAAAQSALKKGERIVFLGDSITQQGNRPGGYVAIVRETVAQRLPEQGVEVIGAGISGHKVPDLQGRLDRDVISKKPTIVVIYIGINDVWHSQNNRGTSVEDYEKGLRDLVKRIDDAGARVILCTPSVIGEKTDGTNPLDVMLEQYAAISRKVAGETGSQMLDLRNRFKDHLQKHNSKNQPRGMLTGDGVHLNASGNQFVAEKMLEALGVGDTAQEKLLRHVVLFKFKEDASQEQVDEIAKAFAALPEKIDVIQDFEWGTDVSVEDKAAGFTHGFVVTFRTEEGRATYLPHAAHQEFVSLLRPHLDKVLVFDYWASP